MKQISTAATPLQKAVANPFLLFTLLILLFSAGSCSKEASIKSDSLTTEMSMKKTDMLIPNDMLSNYSSLSMTTRWELQQARAATARYRDLKNALKDGYEDINVVSQNMGYHFMKMANVDDKFDYKNPEILVYNKMDNGSMQLVAVEYAVPLSLSANAPEGFSGTDDVWNENKGFQLWLLHAWVWYHNPAGVFNPTNSLVHLH